MWKVYHTNCQNVTFILKIILTLVFFLASHQESALSCYRRSFLCLLCAGVQCDDGGLVQQLGPNSWLRCLDETQSLCGWHLGGPSCCCSCRTNVQGRRPSSQACQLPGSLLGYSSGPPTTSHRRPSAPPCMRAKPGPALHEDARRGSEQGGRHDSGF